VLGVRDEAGAYTLYRELGDEYDERSARMASIEDAEGLEGIKDAQNAIATELTRRRERVAAAKALRPASCQLSASPARRPRCRGPSTGGPFAGAVTTSLPRRTYSLLCPI
jgi:uncharacterized protein with von Willebrand factor type A (vWA) domain